MSVEQLVSAAQKLSTSVDALAAVGAELRLRRNGTFAPPRIRQMLQEVVQAIDPHMVDGVTAEQETAALAVIESLFRQALDLLENPERSPGWAYTDPKLLQGPGIASRRFARAIETFAAQRPQLAAALAKSGSLLDVGTGVAGLAIEVARSWPAWRAVGIDRWQPSLSLAQENISAAGMHERVEIRLQGVDQLEDRDAFTLAWLPGQFLSPGIMPAAIERTHRALIDGGWLVIGIFAPMKDTFGEAVHRLKIARDGGHPWSVTEISGLLQDFGFIDIESFSHGPPTLFVIGQKPH
jgi:Methyltransferase domain